MRTCLTQPVRSTQLQAALLAWDPEAELGLRRSVPRALSQAGLLFLLLWDPRLGKNPMNRAGGGQITTGFCDYVRGRPCFRRNPGPTLQLPPPTLLYGLKQKSLLPVSLGGPAPSTVSQTTGMGLASLRFRAGSGYQQSISDPLGMGPQMATWLNKAKEMRGSQGFLGRELL